jgi:hypothetical protein
VEDVFKIADAIESNINIITTTSNNIKENIHIENKEHKKGTIGNDEVTNEVIDLIADNIEEEMFIEETLALAFEKKSNLQPNIERIKSFVIKDKNNKKIFCEKYKEIKQENNEYKKELDEKNKEIEYLKQQLNKLSNFK